MRFRPEGLAEEDLNGKIPLEPAMVTVRRLLSITMAGNQEKD
ncbi:MAG: hypothetical protein WCK86_18720 [Planctomycetia bacterium]